jgi:hypothetical protein
MAWEIEHIKWKGFDKNPQNINLNWRPKKGIWLVNDELKAKWYNPATKQDIETNYMSLLQLSKEELVELWKDESKPMLIRIIAKNMLWWKGFDIIEKMLDRWIWKAKSNLPDIDWKDIKELVVKFEI